MTILVSFSGLPGVGKTTLARELARRTRAIHLRVDTVEAALKRSLLRIHPAEDAGYLAIASLAIDNLLLGFDVIADTVNPVEVSRKLWADAAVSGNAQLLNIEVVCSDQAVHRSRVETRRSDIAGLIVPDWEKVLNRAFEPWRESRVTVDTSIDSIEKCASKIAGEMTDLKSIDL